ncbi:MFS transporter [Thiospirochaeta perfilievii]|uniref:MFS transporter n=1 Tax=Thiospirochaeta perfilievii TaxID=252967 RepID=A0A5C1QI53_9SPIO|nr:MFS transporter [Thiospirochaeta perfilievii]QEN05922.1 MFS transporter [Thiospirochaeta perfilievii]
MNKPKLTVALQIFYGFGVSYAIVDQIFSQWVIYFYLPPEGSGLTPLLPPIFIGLAFLISRFVDAIADPLVGYWSDRVTSKWGRRIPFIAVGAIPLLLVTVLFFYPPKDSTQYMVFLHLSIVGCLFFIFYTIVGAPYNALIPEISHSQKDRINLSTWQSVFRLIYTAVAMIAPGILIKVLGKGDTLQGVRYMVISLCILAAVGMYITVFTIDEKKLSGGKTSNYGLKESLRHAFKNRAFIIYLFGFLFFFIGFNTLRATMNYYVIDIMGLGTGSITIVAALLFGVSALFFYPVNILSKKFGYRKLMIISLFMLSGVSLLLFNLGKIFPTNLGYLFFALAGIPIAGAGFIFPPAMLSEITAVSTQKTGIQIEGIFFGIQGFFLKLAFMISGFVIPVILVMGSNLSFIESLITVPEKAQQTGIYYTAIFSLISFLISAVLYFFYPEEILKDE